MPKNKKYIHLTADAIILDKKGEVLLTKRGITPCKGYWVVPGGHVDYGERVRAAIVREAKEETGLKIKLKDFLGIYDDPKRDPRYHTVSVVYTAMIVSGKLTKTQEATELKFFPLNKLPKNIGFDHRKMVEDYRKMSLRGPRT